MNSSVKYEGVTAMRSVKASDHPTSPQKIKQGRATAKRDMKAMISSTLPSDEGS